MGRAVLLGLRVRLMLLALIAVVPAFRVIVWTGFEQRAQRCDQVGFDQCLRVVRAIEDSCLCIVKLPSAAERAA